jgi:hypothetical protein
MPTKCQDSDPPLGGVLYAGGYYSEGGYYMPDYTVGIPGIQGTGCLWNKHCMFAQRKASSTGN